MQILTQGKKTARIIIKPVSLAETVSTTSKD
jgi:hypothetical protein